MEETFTQKHKALFKAAKEGDATAQTLIGVHFSGRYAGSKSIEYAYGWLLEAVHQDHAPAYTAIGDIYMREDWYEYNPDSAYWWYSEAARRGDDVAMYKLGKLCLCGVSLKKNYYAEAAEWFKMACGKGNADAWAALGDLYAEGRGVNRSYYTAWQCYRRAERSGRYSEAKIFSLFHSHFWIRPYVMIRCRLRIVKRIAEVRKEGHRFPYDLQYPLKCLHERRGRKLLEKIPREEPEYLDIVY